MDNQAFLLQAKEGIRDARKDAATIFAPGSIFELNNKLSWSYSTGSVKRVEIDSLPAKLPNSKEK